MVDCKAQSFVFLNKTKKNNNPHYIIFSHIISTLLQQRFNKQFFLMWQMHCNNSETWYRGTHPHFLFKTNDINTTVLYYRSPTVKRTEHRALFYPFWHRPIFSGEIIKKKKMKKRRHTCMKHTPHGTICEVEAGKRQKGRKRRK